MENIKVEEMAQKILDGIQKEYKEMKKLNVMVLGKTGVGKSTLINNMFSENVADTGIGRPITSQIRKYEVPNFPLAIFDTPGLELGGNNAVDVLLKEVIDQIKSGLNSGDISEAIHCILYCISTPSNRFEQTEEDFLKQFLDDTKMYHVPVIVVLTQSYSKKHAETLKQEIKKRNLDVVNIIPVLAQDYEIDEGYIVPAYGLNKLSTIMEMVLPDQIKKTFVSVQCANLELKKIKAQAVVTASAAVAAGIGATPIPFSDAALLIPEQATMIAGISAVFGLHLKKSVLAGIISATVGCAGTTVLGKSVVTSLLKMIPGVGSVIGGVISGATASALTVALGEAYIAIMVDIFKGTIKMSDLETRAGQEKLKEIFMANLKKKRQ